MLLELVVSGYTAEKDIVDPVWNHYCLLNAVEEKSMDNPPKYDLKNQKEVSASDKKLH
jgi:hypothetical protein